MVITVGSYCIQFCIKTFWMGPSELPEWWETVPVGILIVQYERVVLLDDFIVMSRRKRILVLCYKGVLVSQKCMLVLK